MASKSDNKGGQYRSGYVLYGASFMVTIVAGYALAHTLVPSVSFDRAKPPGFTRVTKPERPPLNKAAYDAKMLALAHRAATSSATSTPHLWPPKTVYPHGGALLPFNRIVAYYGNFLSRQMGILGEYPRAEVLAKLQAAVAEWQIADPSTPVIPAIDYIAITAQADPGKDGMYRLRMPDTETQKALDMAREINGIVFLEVQVGKSTLAQELPLLESFLKQPQVHLALDPEFAMKKSAPGTVIGFMTADDINYAAEYIAGLVRTYDLPPKVLLVHRFTTDMVRNAEAIRPLPEVQVVMVMDGWGPPEQKIDTHEHIIYPEPVQFTGFKIFYKNDRKPPSRGLLTPAEVLKLTPQPSFIQYQ